MAFWRQVGVKGRIVVRKEVKSGDRQTVSRTGLY